MLGLKIEWEFVLLSSSIATNSSSYCTACVWNRGSHRTIDHYPESNVQVYDEIALNSAIGLQG